MNIFVAGPFSFFPFFLYPMEKGRKRNKIALLNNDNHHYYHFREDFTCIIVGIIAIVVDMQ